MNPYINPRLDTPFIPCYLQTMPLKKFFRRLIQPSINEENAWQAREKADTWENILTAEEKLRRASTFPPKHGIEIIQNDLIPPGQAYIVNRDAYNEIFGESTKIKWPEEKRVRPIPFGPERQAFIDKLTKDLQMPNLNAEESPVDNSVDNVDNNSPEKDTDKYDEGETSRDEFTLGHAWSKLNSINQSARYEMEELNHQRKQIEEQQAKLAYEANQIDKKLEQLSHFRSRIEPITNEIENHINNGALDGRRPKGIFEQDSRIGYEDSRPPGSHERRPATGIDSAWDRPEFTQPRTSVRP